MPGTRLGSDSVCESTSTVEEGLLVSVHWLQDSGQCLLFKKISGQIDFCFILFFFFFKFLNSFFLFFLFFLFF